jgi:hypothetical protein
MSSLRLVPNWLILLILFQPMACRAAAGDTLTRALPAHAHNDYLHERPLFDALKHGFRSIEADVYSLGDSLYVAHNRKDVAPGRTLRGLYLEPLRDCFSEERFTLYDSASPLILLVDIKDDGLTSYQLLDRILQDYREILCSAGPETSAGGKVMVVVSGNRPIDFMRQQSHRFAFVDGRLEDLSEDYSPRLMPLVSDRWTKYFSWTGKGEMPEKQRTQLRSYVQQAHAKGQLIRFWSTPDAPGREREAVWTELQDAGADLINTDDLAGLRAFLSTRGQASKE